MGYKGTSYMGIEITNKNGDILTKEEDLKDGDIFSVFNDVHWWVVQDNKTCGKFNNTYCVLEFAKDDRKCWIAAGFYFLEEKIEKAF